MLWTYLPIKTAHILCVILWLACLAGDLWMLAYARDRRVLESWKDSGSALGHGALLGVWCFGLLLFTQGGWQHSRWMRLKLLLVLALSGVHGTAAARLRRRVETDVEELAGYLPGWVVTLTVVIVTLVVNKPW